MWLPLTQTWLFKQVSALDGDGISCSIVCERMENLDQFAHHKIYCLKQAGIIRYYFDRIARKLRLRTHLGYLSNVIRKNRAEILHSHFGHVAWANITAAKSCNVKHIATYYGWDVNYLPHADKRWIKRYRSLFNSANRILCEGEHMAESLVKMGCPEDKIIVHRLGIDIDNIPYVPRVWNGVGAVKILIAAGFKEKKGIPYAIEALASIKDEVPIEITIVGDAGREERSQEEKKRIIKKIDELDLWPITRLTGYLSHKDLINEALKHQIFISPSVTARDGDTEGGCPVSLIEMLATGMVVISTNHCDIPELIKHKVTGLLSEERDVLGLANNIRWAISNCDKWTEIAKEGKSHVEREYNSSIQASKLEHIYMDVLNRN